MKDFRETWVPGIIGYSIIGIVALALLLFLRKMVVVPIIKLSNIAEQLSQGRDIKRIRCGSTYEINNLALQLIKIKHFVRREQKIRAKQKELLKIIRDSDREKEVFLRELYHATNTPLNMIMMCSEMIIARTLGNNMDDYSEYFKLMENAGKQIESYTTDILHTSLIDINELISRCIVLQKKKASEIRLNLEVDIEKNIPQIYGDELRLRQVIIGTLSQAIFCMQDFGTIKIAVTTKKSKGRKAKTLIIKIVDDGLGVNEQDRMRQWERAFGNPDQIDTYTRNSDITHLNFPIIRHLVKLHRGSFDLKTKSKEGSIFTITLPYLTKQELETTPAYIIRTVSDNPKASKLSSANVIKFPGTD